jgi:hypothetical protein
MSTTRGAVIWMTGLSGAGKSTLFDLLLRFYDPQQGSVLIDGLDNRHADLLALRSHIAIVSQQPAMFTGNVRENIRYGRPDATDAQVLEAAQAAFASEFIEQLPEGYDSYLGESGIRLSGGQRQRLAIHLRLALRLRVGHRFARRDFLAICFPLCIALSKQRGHSLRVPLRLRIAHRQRLRLVKAYGYRRESLCHSPKIQKQASFGIRTLHNI